MKIFGNARKARSVISGARLVSAEGFKAFKWGCSFAFLRLFRRLARDRAAA
jgi:hypothetical protein